MRESVEDAAELHREHQKRHNIIRARERCNELEQLLRDSAVKAAQDAAHAAHHAQHTAQPKRETARVQEEQSLMMGRASADMKESAKVIAESETARIKVHPGREVNCKHDVKASCRWHHLAPDSDDAKVKGACHHLLHDMPNVEEARHHLATAHLGTEKFSRHGDKYEMEAEDGVEGSVEQGRVEDAAKAALGHAPKQAALQDAPKAPKQANSAALADPAIPTHYQVRISKTRYKRLRFNTRIGTHIGTHIGTQIVQCVRE